MSDGLLWETKARLADAGRPFDTSIEVKRNLARDTRKHALACLIVCNQHFIAVVVVQATPSKASLSATQCCFAQSSDRLDRCRSALLVDPAPCSPIKLSSILIALGRVGKAGQAYYKRRGLLTRHLRRSGQGYEQHGPPDEA
jgi:hypothetical protein